MGKLAWYYNRLMAMSPREVAWRLSQKFLQYREEHRYARQCSVLEPLYSGVDDMVDAALTYPTASPFGFAAIFAERPSAAPTDFPHNEHSGPTAVCDCERIKLLGPFQYEYYATDWHAGFNTSESWPLEPSYDLEYKQCDNIGDARINWELNRHRQFTRLAYVYSKADSDEAAMRLFQRLDYLVGNWDDANPFLHGISWTSPMEIALRAISWMATARLLLQGRPSNEVNRLVRQLLTGVANMTLYVHAHKSGFSSANNHLIVEASAVLLAALMFHREDLVEASISTLNRELNLQVTADGVDKESSLHYHGFVLEAYLLSWSALKAVGRDVPAVWRDRLAGMVEFVKASRVAGDTYCVFGDDDEARIVDYGFGNSNYYNYLLALYNLLTENSAPAVMAEKSVTFPEGGYSFLRKGEFFVGVDHAPLGFGTIAAHGHCDALSFQLFVAGEPVFIDSATYHYHIDMEERNRLRTTAAHNTVTINGEEQSQMLGAFLWGKKAACELLDFSPQSVTASVVGMSGVTHTRSIRLDETLEIADQFDLPCEWVAHFILSPSMKVYADGNIAWISRKSASGELHVIKMTTSHGSIIAENVEVASSYGKLITTTALRIIGDSHENLVTLHFR
jgi:hypothetical protein